MKTKQVNNIEPVDMKHDLQVAKQEETPSAAIPVLDYVTDSLQQSKTSRRDFLKTMGFSVSAAALAASCEIPIKKAIPYLNQPEHITPGKALYYASSYFDGKGFSNILVKTRDGRPIKIDANPDAPMGSSASATTQASIISLYDHTRFQAPQLNGEEASWEQVDSSMKAALSKVNGQVVLLTGAVISPTVQAAIDQFSAQYNARHVVFSAHGADAVLLANEEQFGQKAVPVYQFQNAEVVASFGADFLGNWLGGTSFYAKDYISNRKISADNPTMSRHYQVESMMSLTGMNADKRKAMKPSAVKAALFQLHNILAGKMGSSSVSGVGETDQTEFLTAMADDLAAARGKALVVCGLNDVECQKAANAINSILGSYGSTINFGKTLNTIQGDSKEAMQVLADMKSGRIGAVLMHGANPVFHSPAGEEFAAELEKIDLVASFDMSPNESNAFASHILPDSHYLEGWADYEPVSGSMAMAQPTIRPLFNTRQFGESLARLSGEKFEEDQSFVNYMQNAWSSKFGSSFQETWDNAVRAGFMEADSSTETSSAPFSAGNMSYTATSAGESELVLYEDKIGNGEHAGNPYLQELPDPVTKVSWDNYAAISPKYARELGVYVNRNVRPAREMSPVITLTANGKSVDVPVYVQPGVAYGTIAVARGYGRNVAGLVGSDIGVNVNPLAPVNDGVASNFTPVEIAKTGKSYELANSQVHYTINDDRPTVREATLEQYQENHKAGNEFRYLPEFEHAVEPTLYPEKEFPAHHWGMTVDLNSCFGCGACVVACNVENNVPVVGKDEMANHREMHWIRIDRYFASANEDPKSDDYMEDPKAVFMPMMCQHCDNAPCENVCPVNATNHSSEGLNQMAYNRCIGTRYCANNCPFKVRRFNWYDYWGADSWGDANDIKKNEVNSQMRNEFSRMILNPDVTVRSRGVIEKCSFCVQRIQEAKLDAKINNKGLDANTIKTACQSACPADAIVFGDTNNKTSTVHENMKDPRNYFVLEEYHVKPSVGYLTKVTNADVAMFDKSMEGIWKTALENNEHGDGHGDGHGEEGDHGVNSHGETGTHGATNQEDNDH